MKFSVSSAATAAVALIGVVIGVGVAQAAPISYVMEPGASVTLGGDAEAISGFFTWDASTFTESDLSITLAGPNPFAGTYVSTAIDISGLQGDADGNVVCGDSATNTICLIFHGELGLSSIPLDQLGFSEPDSFGPDGNAQFLVQASGTATPETPGTVPEPASLALLGMGLVGLGLVRRGKAA